MLLYLFAARTDQVQRLINDGIKDKVWYEGWSPDDTKGDFAGFLAQKIKNLRKRKSLDEKKERLHQKMKK